MRMEVQPLLSPEEWDLGRQRASAGAARRRHAPTIRDSFKIDREKHAELALDSMLETKQGRPAG